MAGKIVIDKNGLPREDGFELTHTKDGRKEIRAVIRNMKVGRHYVTTLTYWHYRDNGEEFLSNANLLRISHDKITADRKAYYEARKFARERADWESRYRSGNTTIEDKTKDKTPKVSL